MKEETQKPEPAEKRMIEVDRQIAGVRFTPCGRFLLAGGYDGTVRRWDVSGEEPSELKPVKGHHGWVQLVEASSDQKTAFSADSWGRLQAWSYAEEDPQPIWHVDEAHNGWIKALAVSSDQSFVVTGGRDGAVKAWSTTDGSLIREFTGHSQELHAAAIHPDSKSIVTADLLGKVKHWQLDSEMPVREFVIESMHMYDRIQDVPGIRVLRFDDSGDQLFVAGSEPTNTGRMIGIPAIRQVDWNSLETNKTWHLGTTPTGYVFDFARHSSGMLVIVTSGTPGNGQFLLLNPEDEEPFFTYTKISNCHGISLHPNEKTVAISGSNRNSQGNGAVRDKEGNYVGNWSPIHLFDLAPEAKEAAAAAS